MKDEELNLREALQDRSRAVLEAICTRMFGCESTELDLLMNALTGVGFLNLCVVLDQIRRAPVHQRPTMELSVPLVLARDLLPYEKAKHALAVTRVIIQRFPAEPAVTPLVSVP